MSAWIEYSLGDVCRRLSSGKNITARDIHDVGEYVVFGGNGVRGYTSKSNFVGECAIIGRQGAYCGNVRYFHGEAWMSEHAVVAEAKPEHDSRFLACLLSTMNLGSLSGQAAQPGLSVKVLSEQKLFLPDGPTQHRVSEVLRAFDDLILNNRRRIEVLEEMMRAIYREWFVKFRFPGHQDVPLVDSVRGSIPEGWSAQSLNDIVTIAKASADPSTLPPETPAIGLEHIPRKQITLEDWDIAAHQGSRKAIFQKGDVLFGKIRPYFHKVSVAPVSGICSTDAIVIRPDNANWGQVVLTVSSDEFVAHATQTSNGTKMPRADWKVLGKWEVVVPPADLAETFTSLVRDQLTLAETLMFENRRLSELRDRLLPKLVTGEIDVSGFDMAALVAEGVVV